MKKIIFTVAAIFAFGFANAQEKKEASAFGFSKGNIMLEGNLGFSSSTETDSFGGSDIEEDKTSSVNFNPKVGYFLTDKIALGVELGIGSSTNENTQFGSPDVVTENKSNSFGAGVFARYYFLDLGERFKTYAEAGLGFGSSKNETNSVETSNTTNVGFGVDLGINYFLTPRFAINFGLTDLLSFNSQKTEFPGGGETQSNNFNGNFNVFNNFFNTAQFGLTYKF
ncbi:MAG: outer membrane beta-barrel protein [Bacteroidota bacterium]